MSKDGPWARYDASLHLSGQQYECDQSEALERAYLAGQSCCFIGKVASTGLGAVVYFDTTPMMEVCTTEGPSYGKARAVRRVPA